MPIFMNFCEVQFSKEGLMFSYMNPIQGQSYSFGMLEGMKSVNNIKNRSSTNVSICIYRYIDPRRIITDKQTNGLKFYGRRAKKR